MKSMQPNRTSNSQARSTCTIAPINGTISYKLRMEMVLKKLSYPLTTGAIFYFGLLGERIKIFLITEGYNFKKVRNSSLGDRKLMWMGNFARCMWFVRFEADDTVYYCDAGVGNKREMIDSEKKMPMCLCESSLVAFGGHDTQYCDKTLLHLGGGSKERGAGTS